VITRVVDESAVIDWVEWLDLSQEIYAEAQNFGITKYGISLPINSGSPDKVIFSVNADSDLKNWGEQRGLLVKRFRPFAKEFHLRMMTLVESKQLGAAIYLI
jgi:hypothetical protein